MNYFDSCKTAEDVKTTYRLLAKKFHPDLPTGNKKIMNDIIDQYNMVLPKFQVQEFRTVAQIMKEMNITEEDKQVLKESTVSLVSVAAAKIVDLFFNRLKL